MRLPANDEVELFINDDDNDGVGRGGVFDGS